MSRILVAGQSRSGSTLLCKIINIMFKQNNVNHTLEFDHPCFSRDSQTIKIHKYNSNLHRAADLVFTCRRDLRDSIVSGYKTVEKPWNSAFGRGWTYHTVGKDLLLEYLDWEDKQDYEFVYEEYFKDKNKILDEVASILGLVTQPDIILEELEKDKPVHIDDNSKLHLRDRKGVASNGGKIGVYKTYFSKEEIEDLNEVYGDWLKRKGYL